MKKKPQPWKNKNADAAESQDYDLNQAEKQNKENFKDNYKNFYNDVKNTNKTEDW